MNLLIVGDPHSTPHYDNDRFDALGDYIASGSFDHVVVMGDLWDFASLGSYDRGKRGWDKQSVYADLECGREAAEAILAPSLLASKRRKKAYGGPRFHFVTGNHEDRLHRVIGERGEFAELLEQAYRKAVSPFHEVTRFREFLSLGGVLFTHFLPGKMGHALAGVNLARSILTKSHKSIVVGHSHVLDYSVAARPDGSRMFGLSAGCFVHPKHDEGWSRGTDQDWWRGVIELHGLRDGFAEGTMFVGMEKML